MPNSTEMYYVGAGNVAYLVEYLPSVQGACIWTPAPDEVAHANNHSTLEVLAEGLRSSCSSLIV